MFMYMTPSESSAKRLDGHLPSYRNSLSKSSSTIYRPGTTSP
ncbi:MAG: hypothetical protein ACLR5G_01040 [Eubacteriales bacterium]